jgi:predicted nucleotidyltransferase/DNA-binding transcriptional ArsR family regulator
VRLLTSKLAVKLIPVLSQAGEATLAELARILDATPSSVQRALEILGSDGIVNVVGAGRSRRYALDGSSHLLEPVERLVAALLGPRDLLTLAGRANPAVELVGVSSTDFVVVFRKRSRAMDQSRIARAARSLADEGGLGTRFLHHEDLRRSSSGNDETRRSLASGQVLVGDLDVSLPDRSSHRHGPAVPLGRLNASVRLPSARTIQALKRRHGVRGMRVFGSAVRTDFRPDSDIDIAVEFPPDAKTSLKDLEALEEDLERRIGRDVDLVLQENLHPAVRWLIDKEAVGI